MTAVRILFFSLLMSAGAAGFILGFLYWCQLPSHDYSLGVATLDAQGEELRGRLQQHVHMLAGTFGYRNLNRGPQALAATAGYIENVMTANGFEVKRHVYKIGEQDAVNLYASIDETPTDELLIVGAHYDSWDYSPGADDNASGVAMLIELSRVLKEMQPRRNLMFVFFTCEEPPFYETPNMGSTRFIAEILRQERRPYRMINLESVGYFTQEAVSQLYPFPLNLIYHPVGDFIGFVSDMTSRGFLKDLVFGFRANSSFPTGASSLPAFLPGVDWSDHAAFWRVGKKAIMITDSALFRNPYYHTRNDRPDLLDYRAMSHVTKGLAGAIVSLSLSGRQIPL